MIAALNLVERGVNRELDFSALLSQALIAFTIEFDNEAEVRMQHRTSRSSKSTKGPWLVSMAMWFNCMRFVDEKGIALEELYRLAHTETNLAGMVRWGYVSLDSSTGRDKKGWIVRATTSGLKAREVWSPLVSEIEGQWRQRYGADFEELSEALRHLVALFPYDLPDCMPILGYGLRCKTLKPIAKTSEGEPSTSFPALLAKALLAFALVYERSSEVSLAIGANVLRLVDEEGVQIKDLPSASGISKEAIAMATGFLQRGGLAVIQTDGRFKKFRLTEAGLKARTQYFELLESTSSKVSSQLGAAHMERVEAGLRRIVLHGRLSESLLANPTNWRAALPALVHLPYFPTVLHRGGYPDGS